MVRRRLERVLLALVAASAGCAPSQHAVTADATSAAPAPVVATAASAPAAAPVADRVEHRFDLSHADYLAVADGSVWVKRDSGVLSRIDPGTNTVLASLDVQPPGARPCQGLGADADSVWTCGGGTALAQVDPATGTVVRTVEVGKSSDQGRLPVAFGHAWVLTGSGSTLVGVEDDTGEVTPAVDLETRCTELDATADALWAACFTDGVVLRIDPHLREVTARVEGLPGARNLVAGDAVFVAYEDGIARIDAQTAHVTAAVDVLAGRALGSGLAASGADLWVRAQGLFLQRLDARTLEVREVLDAPETSGGSVLVAFGSVWASAFDDGVLYRLRPRA